MTDLKTVPSRPPVAGPMYRWCSSRAEAFQFDWSEERVANIGGRQSAWSNFQRLEAQDHNAVTQPRLASLIVRRLTLNATPTMMLISTRDIGCAECLPRSSAACFGRGIYGDNMR